MDRPGSLATARLLANRSRAAAFLCYHSIAPTGPRYLSLPPETFERQLGVLRRGGWSTGTSQTLEALVAGERAGAPTAFLTFDDGFLDNHATALPLLREYGMKGIVFVLPPFVDEGAALDWPEVDEQLKLHPGVMRSIDWTMAGELTEAGIEIGSHGMTHPHMDRLGNEELRQELLDSRRAIEARLGTCLSLAYPFGDWSEDVARAAADAGYRFAFTMPRDDQRGATPWSIPRIPIDYRDDERRFALRISAVGRALLLSPVKPAARRLRGLLRG